MATAKKINKQDLMRLIRIYYYNRLIKDKKIPSSKNDHPEDFQQNIIDVKALLNSSLFQDPAEAQKLINSIREGIMLLNTYKGEKLDALKKNLMNSITKLRTMSLS